MAQVSSAAFFVPAVGVVFATLISWLIPVALLCILQYFLSVLSAFDPYIPPVSVDGVFGAATENAVRSYQRLFGIDPSGVVGSVSWNSILDTYLVLTEGGSRQTGQFPG